MFSELTQPNGAQPLIGVIENPPVERIDDSEGYSEVWSDDDEDKAIYKTYPNLSRQTWGDQMIQARFQLLTETISDVDGENSTPEQRRAALQDLVDGFDELTAYLNRVVRVTRNGRRIDMREVPMDYIEELMQTIANARARRTASKN
jgi:hypothetical protein